MIGLTPVGDAGTWDIYCETGVITVGFLFSPGDAWTSLQLQISSTSETGPNAIDNQPYLELDGVAYTSVVKGAWLTKGALVLAVDQPVNDTVAITLPEQLSSEHRSLLRRCVAAVNERVKS